MEIKIEWKYVKSYKTRAGLDKKLEDEGLNEPGAPRFIIVKRPDNDEWTVIVLATEYVRKHGGYAGGWGGFLVI